MADDVEVGSVVQLKSGGPRMTVRKIKHLVECQWFNGATLEIGRFAMDQLRSVPPET